MGLIASFLLAVAAPTVSGLVAVLAFFTAEWKTAGLALVTFAATAPMALWLVRMTENALRQFRVERWARKAEQPRASFGVWLARQLPTIPFLLRFPLTLWWLSHFLAGVIVVEFRGAIAREMGIPAPNGAVAILFCFAFQFAASVFLTLAIGSAQTSPEITASVWRYRFWINGFVLLILAARIFW